MQCRTVLRTLVLAAGLGCLGTYFRQAGYDAAYSGKWHFGYDIKDTAAHGFEVVAGKVKGNYDGARDRGRGEDPRAPARQAVRSRRQFPESAQHLRVGAAAGWSRAGVELRRDRRSTAAGPVAATPGHFVLAQQLPQFEHDLQLACSVAPLSLAISGGCGLRKRSGLVLLVLGPVR